MNDSLNKFTQGYHRFRKQYAEPTDSLMAQLGEHGQSPKAMVIACCDSRVDPALVLQCDPGDLFIVRNIANLVSPCNNNDEHNGTSAALEFGLCHLNIPNLIILGHSQCGGMNAFLNQDSLKDDSFITGWIRQLDSNVSKDSTSVDETAQLSLLNSYQNALSFPWIQERVDQNKLAIHLWFFDIKQGQILNYSFEDKTFKPLA